MFIIIPTYAQISSVILIYYTGLAKSRYTVGYSIVLMVRIPTFGPPYILYTLYYINENINIYHFPYSIFHYILYYSLYNYICGHIYLDFTITTHYYIVFYHFNNS